MSAFADIAPLIQVLGPALQPFLASGGAVGILFLIVLLVQSRKPKQSREDIETDQWDHKKMTELREENDHLRTQLRENEDRMTVRLRTAEMDRDDGWNRARAMSIIAHDLWHLLANETQKVPTASRTPMPPQVPLLDQVQGVSAYAFPDRYARAPGAER